MCHRLGPHRQEVSIFEFCRLNRFLAVLSLSRAASAASECAPQLLVLPEGPLQLLPERLILHLERPQTGLLGRSACLLALP